SEVSSDTLLREGYHNDVLYFVFYFNDTHNNLPLSGAYVDVSWEGGLANVTDLNSGYYLVELTLTATSPRLYDVVVTFNLQDYTMAVMTVRVVIKATPANIICPATLSVPKNDTAQVALNVISDLTNETISGLIGFAYWEGAGAVPLITLENGSYAFDVPGDLAIGTYHIQIGFSTTLYSLSPWTLELIVRPVATTLFVSNTTIESAPGGRFTLVITYFDLDHGEGISGVTPIVEYFAENITYLEDRTTETNGIYELEFIVNAQRTFQITITFTKNEYESQVVEITIRSAIAPEQIFLRNVMISGGFIFIFLALAIIAYTKHFSVPWIIRVLNKMIATLKKGNIPPAPKVSTRQGMVLSIVNEDLEGVGLKKKLDEVIGESVEAIVPEIDALLDRLAEITGLGMVELEAFRQDLARMKASERPGFIQEVIDQEEARRADALAKEEAKVPEEARVILEEKPEELEELRVKLKRKGMADEEIEIIIEQAKTLSKADLEALLDSLGIKL
ncbi:MAG: hypothetical protein ACFE7R_07735, partial [Candidatus Hodarchaeota archaeon]